MSDVLDDLEALLMTDEPPPKTRRQCNGSRQYRRYYRRIKQDYEQFERYAVSSAPPTLPPVRALQLKDDE